MDLEFLDKVKRSAIIAMFSDDDLMEKLVLKGGNLLDIVYGISTRASKDVDLSMPGQFDDLELLRRKVENALKTTFLEIGYVVFDVTVEECPPKPPDDLSKFWGGYKLYYKIVEKDKYEEYKGDVENLRRRAVPLQEAGSTRFPIEISKHEYCDAKEVRVLDDYTIVAYTPQALVCEKLRAICQQMPEYVEIVHGHRSARARDFLDIHTVAEHFQLDFTDKTFQDVLKAMFAAKRVPVGLIGRISESEYKEYHRQDYPSVEMTVKPGIELQGFDFYFNYVVEKCRDLESLWNE